MARHRLWTAALLVALVDLCVSLEDPPERRGFLEFNVGDAHPASGRAKRGDRLSVRMALEGVDQTLKSPNLLELTKVSHRMNARFDLDLRRDSAWTASSKVFIRRGDVLEEQDVKIDPNCNGFHDGQGNGDDGDKMDGRVHKVGIRLVKVLENEDTEQTLEDELSMIRDRKMVSAENEETEGAVGGATTQNSRVTLEMAVFADQYYLQKLTTVRRFGFKTIEEKYKFMIDKYNKFRAIYKSNEYFPIDVELKHLEFWTTDPDYYNVTLFQQKGAGNMLSQFCKHGSETGVAFDVRGLYYGIEDTSRTIAGMAFGNSACKPKQNCFIIRNPELWVHTDMHEVGHTLGLGHDKDNPKCNTVENAKEGFMWKGEKFMKCYGEKMNTTVTPRKMPCLYEENFPDLPVLNVTPDPEDPPVG